MRRFQVTCQEGNARRVSESEFSFCRPLVVIGSRDQLEGAMAEVPTHLLFESASGYAILEAKLHDDIAADTPTAQQSITDFAKFSKMVTLLSFSPFKSAAQALENANDVSEGALIYVCCLIGRFFQRSFQAW
jgi:hypothetical protein